MLFCTNCNKPTIIRTVDDDFGDESYEVCAECMKGEFLVERDDMPQPKPQPVTIDFKKIEREWKNRWF